MREAERAGYHLAICAKFSLCTVRRMSRQSSQSRRPRNILQLDDSIVTLAGGYRNAQFDFLSTLSNGSPLVQ
jgi:hypothetical protein